jgi:hypothetical protein
VGAVRQLSLNELSNFEFELSQLSPPPTARLSRALAEIYAQRIRAMLPGEQFFPSDLAGLTLIDVGFALDDPKKREEFAERVILWLSRVKLLDKAGRRTTRAGCL